MNKLFYLFALIAVSLIHAQGGGGGGVSKIIAGSNVTISPTSGTGIVTINATGGGGGAGVTSVGVSVPSVLSVSGSPVTSSGTIAIGYSGSALPIANGGTAATTPANALISLGAFGYNHDAYILVNTTSSAVTNGNNLLAAYAAAILLTPNGNPLATDNRACVIVPPGNYDLGVQQLLLNTEFVDLSGWSVNAANAVITSTRNNPSEGTINQTANDVQISNLTASIDGTSPDSGDNTDPAAYFPSDTLVNTICRNVVFSVNSGNNLTMRIDTDYAGSYSDCIAGDLSFGGHGSRGPGAFSGSASNCRGGNDSFAGGGGIFSGTAVNCIGGHGSFGGSFLGVGGFFSGIAIACTAGDGSFAGSTGDNGGLFTGRSVDCFAGGGSFAGSIVNFGGTFDGFASNCFASAGSFAGSLNGNAGNFTGTALNCIGGDVSFSGTTTGDAGTFTGTTKLCTGGNNSFATGNGANGFSGKIQNCTAGDSSFGSASNFASPALLEGCVLTSGTFLTDPALTIVGCFDGTGAVINFPNPFEATAVGTPYSLTVNPLALTFGTTSPDIVIGAPGNYLILGTVVLEFNGATFAASRTVTLKLRRTNNTPADLPNGSTALITGVVTTLTATLAIVSIPPTTYSTTNNDDGISIFASVSVVPTAGSLQATAPGTKLMAIRF